MTTTARRNRDTVRRYIEDAWNEADLDLVEALVATDAPHHDPTLSDRPAGPAGNSRLPLGAGAGLLSLPPRSAYNCPGYGLDLPR